MQGEILSLIISICYLAIAYIYGGEKSFLLTTIFLLLPLACIWFSDEMGKYVGFALFKPVPITSQSPGWLVKFMGWVLLLMPLIMTLIFRTIGNLSR